MLLVDVDPQASLTISMGWPKPDELDTTLATLMGKVLEDKPIQPGEGILHHAEGVDLIPSSIELAGMEVGLVNAMSREKVLKQVLESAKRTMETLQLKPIEQAKILCARKLFNEMSTSQVKYHDVDSY